MVVGAEQAVPVITPVVLRGGPTADLLAVADDGASLLYGVSHRPVVFPEEKPRA